MRADWDELAAGDADGVLLGHDWMAQSWKSCEEMRGGQRAAILALRRNGRLDAVVALRHNRRTRRLCFLEEWRSQRLDLLERPGTDAWSRLGRYFLARRDWDRLDLQFLRAASAERILAEWPRWGLAVRERGRVRQRSLLLARPWPEIEATFSAPFRANLRRRLRRLQALGGLELCVYTRPQELTRRLHECFALERQGWKGTGGTAILDQPMLHRFYRQLAYRLAARGWLRLYCLRVADRLAAFEYCVGDGKSRQISSLKIAYDERLRADSPGTVLRWKLLQQAQQEFDTYEFLGEDTGGKAEWTPITRELRHLRIYNRTRRGRLWLWRAQAWARLRRG